MLSQRYLKLSSFLKIVFSLYSVQLERFSLFCLLVCGFIPLCHLIYCWVLPVFFIFISFTLFLLHSSDLLGSSYFLFHRYSSDCLHLFFQVPWASLWSLPWTLYPVDYLSLFCCAVAQLCPTLCHHMDCGSQASLSFTISWSLLKLMSV